MSKLPRVIKLNSPESKSLVADLARQDNDNMNMPTHAVVKGDQIVGGWNLCEVPMVLLWHHSEKVTARDSIHLNQIQESMLSDKGVNNAYIACNSASPYYSHMDHFGFQPVWSTNIFYKELLKV